ncbi:class I SAM-dependent methyltransferase [Brevibacillus invocatus]|uniref:class I SAM-dependent methyltransferase n=1 Tax=Brevibacillus invocatus TaxID=173959 RepID=UPI00399F37CC
MMNDEKFIAFLRGANQTFQGWDFSWITGTGRMSSELLSWSYGSMAIPLIQKSKALLDMGTGGGELLSKLRPFPRTVVATEGYSPNLPIARERLEPLGVKVVEVDNDECLPFLDAQFDLILNKHESFVPHEVRRIISDRGVFLTQQVGGLDCMQINEAFGVSLEQNAKEWNLEKTIQQLESNRFQVVEAKEEFPVQRFYDVGAFAYYLRAIPWQVPGLNMEEQIEVFYRIHQMIETKGFFDCEQHRFVILAKA